MNVLAEITKCGKELLTIPQGNKKEKLAREILSLNKKIKQEMDSGSDLYEDHIGHIHAYVMCACRELEMYEEALEEGEEALLEEENFDDDFTAQILNELLGVCIILYKRSDNRLHYNNGRKYGKRLLELEPNHKLRPFLAELFGL
jgi:tetratricopeptide (TPR) repeat protein